MASETKLRKSLPAEFDKVKSAVLPEIGVSTILEIAAATAVGGPVGGTMAFVLDQLSSANVGSALDVTHKVAATTNHFVQAFKTLASFVGESEIDALNRLAKALGNPRPVQGEQQPKMLVEELKAYNENFLKAMGTIKTVEGQQIFESYLKCVCEKKTPIWTLEINTTDFPQNKIVRRWAGTNKFVMGLGSVTWRLGPYRLKEEFVQFTKFRSIAPLPGIKEYDLQKDVGVEWEVELKELEIPAEA